MTQKTLLFLILLAATASAARAGKIDNPVYRTWKSFKPGASVTWEDVHEMAGTETRMVTKTTLKELTDKKAVLVSQTTTYVLGNETKQPEVVRVIPAKLDKSEPPEGDDAPKDIEIEKGEETLTIAGKQLACTWVKSTAKTGDGTMVTKVWYSDAVPGATVKLESTSEGASRITTTMTVTEFKTE